MESSSKHDNSHIEYKLDLVELLVNFSYTSTGSLRQSGFQDYDAELFNSISSARGTELDERGDQVDSSHPNQNMASTIHQAQPVFCGSGQRQVKTESAKARFERLAAWEKALDQRRKELNTRNDNFARKERELLQNRVIGAKKLLTRRQEKRIADADLQKPKRCQYIDKEAMLALREKSLKACTAQDEINMKEAKKQQEEILQQIRKSVQDANLAIENARATYDQMKYSGKKVTDGLQKMVEEGETLKCITGDGTTERKLEDGQGDADSLHSSVKTDYSGKLEGLANRVDLIPGIKEKDVALKMKRLIAFFNATGRPLNVNVEHGEFMTVMSKSDFMTPSAEDSDDVNRKENIVSAGVGANAVESFEAALNDAHNMMFEKTPMTM